MSCQAQGRAGSTSQWSSREPLHVENGRARLRRAVTRLAIKPEARSRILNRSTRREQRTENKNLCFLCFLLFKNPFIYFQWDTTVLRRNGVRPEIRNFIQDHVAAVVWSAPRQFSFLKSIFSPISSPWEGEHQQKPRKMRRLKNHANIEKRGNREIREIREPSSAFGGRVWIFRVFRVFRGSKNFLGEDLGQLSGLDTFTTAGTGQQIRHLFLGRQLQPLKSVGRDSVEP